MEFSWLLGTEEAQLSAAKEHLRLLHTQLTESQEEVRQLQRDLLERDATVTRQQQEADALRQEREDTTRELMDARQQQQGTREELARALEALSMYNLESELEVVLSRVKEARLRVGAGLAGNGGQERFDEGGSRGGAASSNTLSTRHLQHMQLHNGNSRGGRASAGNLEDDTGSLSGSLYEGERAPPPRLEELSGSGGVAEDDSRQGSSDLSSRSNSRSNIRDVVSRSDSRVTDEGRDAASPRGLLACDLGTAAAQTDAQSVASLTSEAGYTYTNSEYANSEYARDGASRNEAEPEPVGGFLGAMGMQHGSAAATVVGWSSRGGLGDFSRAPMGLINEHQIVAAPVTPPASAHRGHFPSDVSEPSGGLSCMSEMSEGSRCTNDFLRPLSERGSEEGDVSDDQDDTSPYSALNAAEEAWGDPSHGRLV